MTPRYITNKAQCNREQRKSRERRSMALLMAYQVRSGAVMSKNNESIFPCHFNSGGRDRSSRQLQLAGFHVQRSAHREEGVHRQESAAPNDRKTCPWLTWTSPRWPWHMPETGPSESVSPFPSSIQTSMSTTNHFRHAQQRLRHIATEWPADPLRPKIQLKTFLAALADHPTLSPRAVAATNALHKNHVSSHVSGLSSDSTAESQS